MEKSFALTVNFLSNLVLGDHWETILKCGMRVTPKQFLDRPDLLASNEVRFPCGAKQEMWARNAGTCDITLIIQGRILGGGD